MSLISINILNTVSAIGMVPFGGYTQLQNIVLPRDCAIGDIPFHDYIYVNQIRKEHDQN